MNTAGVDARNHIGPFYFWKKWNHLPHARDKYTEKGIGFSFGRLYFYAGLKLAEGYSELVFRLSHP